jgi:HSP20 family protein
MTADLDRLFEVSAPEAMAWPFFRTQAAREAAWVPRVDVFEKDNQLVAKVDLPGLTRDDVKVEVTNGHLAISGERKSDVEEKRQNFYRFEREYGGFYRAIPMPDGVKLEDVKATFSDGVLEIRVPLPVQPEASVRTVQIDAPPATTKTAA